MSLVCVRCGKKATCGSAKHPFCKKCFVIFWESENEYFKWLGKTHYKK